MPWRAGRTLLARTRITAPKPHSVAQTPRCGAQTMNRRQFCIIQGAPLWITLLCGSLQAQALSLHSGLLNQDEGAPDLESAEVDDADDWTEALKHILLDGSGRHWLDIGGHARARYESWNNFSFGLGPVDQSQDDEFLLTRLVVHADYHFHERGRAFLEVKSALSTDRDLLGGTRTLDVDDFAVQQAFVDWRLPVADHEVTIRPGRQSLQFGKQRLVSPLPWGNTLRAWDGLSVRGDIDGWSATAFWTLFAPVQQHDFNDPDDGTRFWGLYSTKQVDSDLEVDMYLLGLEREAVGFNGTVGDEERYSIGARLGSNPAPDRLDYDVEATHQFGAVGSGDIDAQMFAVELGYSTEVGGMPCRFFAGYDFATGDREPGGDVETFNQLFPLGHAYLGFIDAIGRQNNESVHAGFGIQLTSHLKFALAYHSFRLEDEADALYTPRGAVTIPGGGTRADVGDELDLTLNMALDRHTDLLVGYSRFFAGDVLEESGPGGEDIDFVYLALRYGF